MRDPASAAPPIPWEQEGRGPLVRWAGTIASALRPSGTAPAFARNGVAPAISFALLSFVPFALLAGIIPYTHTLVFGALAVAVRGEPSHVAIALDVLQASGIGLLVATVGIAAIAVSYVSLSRAYADRGYDAAPWRVVLYRAFLLPLAELLRGLAAWTLPASPPIGALLLLELLRAVPYVLLFASLRAGARMASGVGVFPSIAAAAIPMIVMFFAHDLLLTALAPLLPSADTVTPE
jgi:hypothetical protein